MSSSLTIILAYLTFWLSPGSYYDYILSGRAAFQSAPSAVEPFDGHWFADYQMALWVLFRKKENSISVETNGFLAR